MLAVFAAVPAQIIAGAMGICAFMARSVQFFAPITRLT